jgi:hypothetical protein
MLQNKLINYTTCKICASEVTKRFDIRFLKKKPSQRVPHELNRAIKFTEILLIFYALTHLVLPDQPHPDRRLAPLSLLATALGAPIPSDSSHTLPALPLPATADLASSTSSCPPLEVAAHFSSPSCVRPAPAASRRAARRALAS